MELYNVYCSPNIIRMMKLKRMWLVGHVAHMREMRNAYKIVVGMPAGKRSLGRHKHRWVGNIKWMLGNVLEDCGLDSCGLR
jgi:hypothetical protein